MAITTVVSRVYLVGEVPHGTMMNTGGISVIFYYVVLQPAGQVVEVPAGQVVEVPAGQVVEVQSYLLVIPQLSIMCNNI